MDSYQSEQLPRHIAIVMDGNGRWASHRLLPTASGHKAGVETVREVLEACRDLGVNNLTLFAFSSENWSRPKAEVSALMSLFSTYLDKEVSSLNDKNVKLSFIGRRDRFPKSLVSKIDQAELMTASNKDLNLTLAVDYGGQWDIAQAMKKIAQQVAAGKIQPDDISPELISKYVCLADLPLPDLLIRTSGEYRISNFLLWQLAYAEFYFTDVLWPDFGKKDLMGAIDAYVQRERRFGGRQPEVISA